MFLNKQAQKFLWVLSPMETKHTSMFYVYFCVQVQVLTLDPDGPPGSVVLQAGVHHSPGVLCFHLCSWPFPLPSFVHTCSLWGASSQLSLGALAIVSRSCQISPPPCGHSGHDLLVTIIAVSIPVNYSLLQIRQVCTTLLSPALGPGIVNLSWPDDIPVHQILQKNCGVFLMLLFQINSALFFGCFSSFPLTVPASHSQPPWAST